MIVRDELVSRLNAPGFARGVAQAFGLLSRSEKARAGVVTISMSVNAMLDIVGIAGVLPFVHLMLEPEPLAGEGYFARALRWAGFVDVGQALVAVGITLVILVLLKNLYAIVHNGLQNRFSARAEARLAGDLLGRVVRAPYAWLVTRNSSVVRDVVVGQSIEWSRGVIRPSLQLANDLLFLSMVVVLLIAASPGVGVIISVCAIVLAGLMMRIARPRVAAETETKRRAIRLAGITATEAVAGGRDVRLSHAGSMLVEGFDHDMRIYSTADARGRQWQLVPRLGIEVIGFGTLVGVALGALSSGASRAEVAAILTLYAAAAVRALPMVTRAVTSLTGVASSIPAVTEIKALIAELPPPEVTLQHVPPLDWRVLALEGVSFAYTGATVPALGPLDLSIRRGASIGIVGASGTGKSTLVDVIAGLLPPTDGCIRLDDAVLEGERLTAWRARVAYVAQTPFLIDATLADNIEFGAPARADREAHLDRVIAAAGLTEVVRDLPQGRETRLGERGIRLSGGQRQRVAIARALYREADLLILDEATSALDSITEREITDAIDDLKGRLTLIVVAHRLSTVIRCDEIVMLDNGCIAGRGPHARLLTESEGYRRLAAAQTLTSGNLMTSELGTGSDR